VSFSHQIAIGPEFFQKSKNDYRDWRWALAREFYQNSIDAPGSDQIDITINYWKEPNETTVTVANNGAPMTEEILTGKLLALGSSGKDFGQQGQQAVGGFGKAKEVLYFLHKYYHIRTGKLFCAGSGAGYNLARHEEEFWGTSSTIALPGDQVSEIAEQFKKFARLSQWDGVITLSVSGQKMILSDRLKKGYRRRDSGDQRPGLGRGLHEQECGEPPGRPNPGDADVHEIHRVQGLRACRIADWDWGLQRGAAVESGQYEGDLQRFPGQVHR
jgi:hypothetical protein